MAKEFEEKIKDLKEKSQEIGKILNLEEKHKKIEELGKISREPKFWDESQKAGKMMQEIEELKKEVLDIERIFKKISELEELLAMAESDPDFAKASSEEAEKEIMEMEKKLSELEFKTLLSEEYDRNDAILSIYPGAGGVDAQDWSEMLLKMYLKWAEKKGYRARLVNETRGQEAGIKNATIEIEGTYAFGYLKSEAGVHRLVRLSPFNSDNLRQTSFALVEILPVIEEIKEVKIDSKDLRIDTFHSSGAGGQSVNTTDSAVRITHIPTGIVVSCQNERSQLQNKESAMKILKAKLHKKYLEEKEIEKKKIRGEQPSAEWGSQIRSYVVHPYKMVKDHRTKFETAQVEAVLEGDLKDFQESYLRYLKI